MLSNFTVIHQISILISSKVFLQLKSIVRIFTSEYSSDPAPDPGDHVTERKEGEVGTRVKKRAGTEVEKETEVSRKKTSQNQREVMTNRNGREDLGGGPKMIWSLSPGCQSPCHRILRTNNKDYTSVSVLLGVFFGPRFG